MRAHQVRLELVEVDIDHPVEEPFRTQLTVRLREGHALLGVDLPGPCTFTSGNGVDILWMGPDEYLVLAEPGSWQPF